MSKDYTNAPPEGWKSFDQFVVDMTTYRLPATDALAGRELTFDFEASADFPAHTMRLRFDAAQVAWTSVERQGHDAYEAVMVAPDVYFVSTTTRLRSISAGRGSQEHRRVMLPRSRRSIGSSPTVSMSSAGRR